MTVESSKPEFRVIKEHELDEHFAKLYKSFGIEPEAPAEVSPLESGAARYRWRYFPPGALGEDEPEEPTFVVIEEGNESNEYSGFQDFAYEDFGLVDVMAFTYEPEHGLEAVEELLQRLRNDPRLIEDPTVEL